MKNGFKMEHITKYAQDLLCTNYLILIGSMKKVKERFCHYQTSSQRSFASSYSTSEWYFQQWHNESLLYNSTTTGYIDCLIELEKFTQIDSLLMDNLLIVHHALLSGDDWTDLCTSAIVHFSFILPMQYSMTFGKTHELASMIGL